MGKYIKLFQTHAEYETYITGSDKILPNVSYCKNINDVHYNPYVPYADPRLIAKFNVTSTESPTQICYITDSFSEMEIDGVVQSNVVTTYTFDNIGEHTVKYTLSDPTTIVGQSLATCVNLIDVKIPQSVTTMGSAVFQGCTSLPVENGIRYADTYLSGAADKTLSSYIIRDGTKWCNDSAFKGCSSLTSITIPSSVTSIGDGAFSGCSGLTSITIPSGVTSIGSKAFYNCSGITSMSVESGNTVYDSRSNSNAIIETATNTLLYGCQNTIIPSSVTSIGSNAFYGCSGLTSIEIPSSVTSIGINAFQSCTSLTSIEIPSSVTSIGNNTFRDCSGLTSIEIPSSVTSIGSRAFNGCSGLNSITSQATTAPTISSNTFQNVKTGGTLYVPSGSNYSTWMGTGNYYLGKYIWTKEEQ